MTVQIHPSAIVDQGAQIGEGSRVAFPHVCGGARIGHKAVSLGQTCSLGNKVVTGDRGVRLTGGLRQRIGKGTARSVCKRAKVIILVKRPASMTTKPKWLLGR